jgi:hypothetical protein
VRVQQKILASQLMLTYYSDTKGREFLKKIICDWLAEFIILFSSLLELYNSRILHLA